MLIDIIIILLGINAVYRGKKTGAVRQLFSAAGFFAGLFFGSWLQPHTATLAHTPSTRAFALITTILICTVVGLTLGEFIGLEVKIRIFHHHIAKVDNYLGAIFSLTTLLLGIWLLASVASHLPYQNIQSDIKKSWIIGELNKTLPPAPDVVASLGNLIDANGFPDVFIGGEPAPSQVNLPALGSLAGAVNADEASVLRIRGVGCGEIISGSGFVVAHDLVATNAHVIAGVAHPYVQDTSHSYPATPVWFDPNLDFALLRVNNLPEASLSIANSTFARNTAAAVLGYPGGGNFNAGPAAIIDEFKAVGRNIYGTGQTIRDVYEVKANIIPGNSGGPLINVNGKVIGVVFAESTTYNQVGYSLTTPQVVTEINQASKGNQAVSTGSCVND